MLFIFPLAIAQRASGSINQSQPPLNEERLAFSTSFLTVACAVLDHNAPVSIFASKPSDFLSFPARINTFSRRPITVLERFLRRAMSASRPLLGLLRPDDF